MDHAHEKDVHCVLNLSTSHATSENVPEDLNHYLITGGADNKVHVWDLRQLLEEETKEVEVKPFLTLEVNDAVLCMDYCPQNPRYLAVGTASGEIDLFDLLAVGMILSFYHFITILLLLYNFIMCRMEQRNILSFVILVIGMRLIIIFIIPSSFST